MFDLFYFIFHYFKTQFFILQFKVIFESAFILNLSNNYLQKFKLISHYLHLGRYHLNLIKKFKFNVKLKKKFKV